MILQGRQSFNLLSTRNGEKKYNSAKMLERCPTGK